MTTTGQTGESPAAAFMGRVPPQDLEAEHAVLGSMLQQEDVVGLVVEKLDTDDFYSAENAIVFEAMVRLFDRNDPIDMLTLREELKKSDMLDRVGGAEYLMNLTEAVPSAANALYYANIVRERAVLRVLISTTTRILSDAFGERFGPRELLDRAEHMMFEIAGKHAPATVMPIRDILKKTFENIDDIHSREERIPGLRTGFHDLDELTAGLQGSELIILASRPSMGKTTFALNIARNVAVEEEKGVLIFSLEMSKEQLAQNLLCCEARVDAQKLRKGLLSNEQMSALMAAAGRLSEAPIFIDDMPGLTALDVKAKARRIKAQHDIALVVVDYIQLMDTTRLDNRSLEIAEISRSLKALARELKIPVLALSQLNRGPEQREDHRPRNSDPDSRTRASAT